MGYYPMGLYGSNPPIGGCPEGCTFPPASLNKRDWEKLVHDDFSKNCLDKGDISIEISI
jgi:hypothetical protein